MEREGWEVTLDLHARCDRADICRSTGSTPDRGAKERERKGGACEEFQDFWGFRLFLLLLDLCVSLSLAAQCAARAMARRRIREGGEKVEPAVPTGGGSGGGGDAVAGGSRKLRAPLD